MAFRVKGVLTVSDIDRARGNGRQATFVDGEMRWLDKDGKPGAKVDGAFDYIRRGDTYTLYPQEGRPTSTASRGIRGIEDQTNQAR